MLLILFNIDPVVVKRGVFFNKHTFDLSAELFGFGKCGRHEEACENQKAYQSDYASVSQLNCEAWHYRLEFDQTYLRAM